MRIRTIKPEFWTSEDIAALDWQTRLIFIGLWSYVDDNGVGRDVERLIVGALFALEDDPRDTLATVSRALQTLSERGLITRYVVDDKPFLHITTWDKHQRIDRPAKPRYPGPTCGDASSRDTLATPSRDLRDSLDAGTGEQGNRGTGEQKTTTTSSSARGTRLPDDFVVTDAMRHWAYENCPGTGPQDHERFMDYWRAVPGAKGRKTDWEATWRNWMRKESEQRQRPTVTRSNPNSADNRMARAREIAARLAAEDAQRLELEASPIADLIAFPSVGEM